MSSTANRERGRRSSGRLAVFLAGLLLSQIGACIVEQKCYDDSDCRSPDVCNNGKCVFECRQAADCDAAFGVEFVCEQNHCRFPEVCASCSFDNADHSCTHGLCTMGACLNGFIDLNDEADDGCEYECTPSNESQEICDRLDNDCDGKTDEDYNLDGDVENCGSCGNVCPTPPNSNPVCVSGRCDFTCIEGWFDNDGRADNGCEATQCVPVEEVCDGADNDCDCPGDTNTDGQSCGPGDEGVDEGFDKTLPESCGPYCAVCVYAHAVPECVAGNCRMGACETGWYDADGEPDNGCECSPTNGGVEICDQLDNDCNGKVDEGDVCGIDCPQDMVAVGYDFCIDIYEASRRDASASSAGVDNSLATSRPGVLPWMVNPVTYDDFLSFQTACQAAGKHLCTKAEWFLACSGPEPGTRYVFGDTFDRETCNCVDSFCDDYCRDNGIAPADCDTDTNCGYDYNCFHVVPSGSFPDCGNDYGTFDINGNVWEIVPSAEDPRGFEVRGGAFNCASAATRLQCSYNAGWTALYAGFRCCLDP